jgi:hypothetical protein
MSALITAGVLAAGATVYAATSASNSAAAANATNAANVANTNQLNYNEFLQSRGQNGSAIYPIYASGAEQQLYGDTLNTYDATAGLSAAQFQGIANQNAGAQAGANATVGSVFNGGMVANEQAAQGAVNQANQTAVQTQKQGTLEALQQTLNNIKSIQAGKGFVGGGSGDDQLQFNARMGANTTAANAQSQANIANATALQGINQNNNNRMLQNVGLPGQMAQSNIALANAGNTAAEQNQVARQNLFSNFKIGTQAFQYAPLPQVNPVAGTGQIVGQGVGALAGAAGNYASNQQLINGLNGGYGTGATGGYGYGSTYGGTGVATNPVNNPANYNAANAYVPPTDINGNFSFGDG